jgi:hypothetical protein
MTRPTEERVLAAPKLPSDRPCTKLEAWAHESFIWEGIKTHEEIVVRARERWIWSYVHWFNFKAWRKQPDWTEGDPVLTHAVPSEPFYPNKQGSWGDTVYAALEQAREAERRAA